jgi:hypothetical protein
MLYSLKFFTACCVLSALLAIYRSNAYPTFQTPHLLLTFCADPIVIRAAMLATISLFVIILFVWPIVNAEWRRMKGYRGVRSSATQNLARRNSIK